MNTSRSLRCDTTLSIHQIPRVHCKGIHIFSVTYKLSNPELEEIIRGGGSVVPFKPYDIQRRSCLRFYFDKSRRSPLREK